MAWLEQNINTIMCGDCLDVLADCPSNSIDLIVTSPPYADSRKNTYGGIPPNEYIDWFLPRAEQFKRILKPTGSFILNIKEKVVKGERHTYVIELILAMRKQGWLWTEEYLWHKKNSFPGKWKNRFRDAWERCLHFTKQKDFAMYQEAVMVPRGDWATTRLKKKDKQTGELIEKTVDELAEYDKIRSSTELKSGMNRKISNWLDRDLVYPDNVLYLATECGNKQHSAAFPYGLPEWFIKLFTKEADLVLDPFSGSGTTAVAAYVLHRNFLGVEIIPKHVEDSIVRLQKEMNRRLTVHAGF